MSGDETMAVCPHWSRPLVEMPVCGWATVAGLEVPHGTTCMGTGPRKVRLSTSEWTGPQPASCLLSRVGQQLIPGTGFESGSVPRTGGHKDHTAVKRDSDHEGRAGRCASGLVISSGFLEEVTLVWSLPSEVWS